MTTPPPELEIDRRAPVRRIPLGERSWVDVVEGFVRDATDVFTEINETT
jgi:hypothetical protein